MFQALVAIFSPSRTGPAGASPLGNHALHLVEALLERLDVLALLERLGAEHIVEQMMLAKLRRDATAVAVEDGVEGHLRSCAQGEGQRSHWQ